VGGLDESIGIWVAPRDEALYAQLVKAMETGADRYAIVPAPNMATSY
jgi:hypothetical protein